MFVLNHHIMTNSVGLADSKVAAEQAVTNILWEGLVASGQHPDTLLILYSLNISVVSNRSLNISTINLMILTPINKCINWTIKC